MLCPNCGPDGKMEQIGFGSETERFYCHTCKVTYVAYTTGHGEFTEPVPVSDTHLDKGHDR